MQEAWDRFWVVMMVEKDLEGHGRKEKRARSSGCWQPHICPSVLFLQCFWTVGSVRCMLITVKEVWGIRVGRQGNWLEGRQMIQKNLEAKWFIQHSYWDATGMQCVCARRWRGSPFSSSWDRTNSERHWHACLPICIWAWAAHSSVVIQLLEPWHPWLAPLTKEWLPATDAAGTQGRCIRNFRPARTSVVRITSATGVQPSSCLSLETKIHTNCTCFTFLPDRELHRAEWYGKEIANLHACLNRCYQPPFITSLPSHTGPLLC